MTHRQLYAILACAFVVVCALSAWLGWTLGERDHLREVMAHRVSLETLMAERIESVNDKAPADRIVQAILKAADKHRLDPLLALMVAEVESDYNPLAVGLAGERGIFQITKRTARVLNLEWDEAFDIEKNADAGIAYLAKHLQDNLNRKALSRYNGGSRAYAEQVLARYKNLRVDP